MISTNRFVVFLCLGTLALSGSGCAFNPQKVTFAPVTTVAPSQIGKGVSVSVKVGDERDSSAIGHRGTAYGNAAAITSDQNLPAIIEAELVKSLRAQGFDASANAAGTDSSLQVELRLINYDTSTGMWTGGVHIRTTLKARATRGAKSYEQTYRAELEERVSVVPTAEKNEAWLNSSLNNALDQLLGDNKLMQLMATP